MIGEAFSGAFAGAFRDCVKEIGLSREVRTYAASKALPPPPPDGKEEFEQAKSANTLDAYDKFMKAFPSSTNRARVMVVKVFVMDPISKSVLEPGSFLVVMSA